MALLLSFTFLGCFTSTTASSIQPNWLRENTTISEEAKVFTKDGNIYLFFEGFTVTQHVLTGKADWYSSIGGQHQTGLVTIELGSITTITAYGKSIDSGTALASTVGIAYLCLFPLMYFAIAVANGYE